MFNRELKKGSAELFVLSLIEARPRHGYEIGKLIEARSKGRIQFRIGSLYPILCRLEERDLIAGRWVEKAGELSLIHISEREHYAPMRSSK